MGLFVLVTFLTFGNLLDFPLRERLTESLLSGIAKKYGTTVSAIQKLNSSLIKNVNLIQVGWKIRVK